MSAYRILKHLDTGHVPGDVLNGSMFRALDKLVAAGALVKARTPPLAELPGWTERAEKLREISVVTVDDLLDMNPRRGTELFNHKRDSTFIKWVEEAKSWIMTPQPKSGCCK